MKQDSFKPAVSGRWLLLLAGVLWTGVGIMLCDIASVWLSHAYWRTAVSIGLAGCLAGIVAYRFGFLRIARCNMQRIRMLGGRTWILAFQGPRSYATMAFMIGLGSGLRQSPISQTFLASIYLAVGIGLFLASIHYYQAFGALNRLRSRATEPPG